MKKILILVALVFSSTTASGQEPEGWWISGSAPRLYELKTDHENGSPAPSGYLRSKPLDVIDGFGTAMQSFSPDKYLGKRIRLTGFLKTKDLDGSASLWMRVDAESQRGSSFDNMHNRLVKGTTPWTEYSIVLDVSQTATLISFGALLSGGGEIWFDEFKIEEVSVSMPVTGGEVFPSSPVNTSF